MRRSTITPNAFTSRGTDVGKIFEAHRPLIERVASDAYDAGVADEEGRVPVTVDALELARGSA
jgi:hypothetical protein